MNNAVSTPNAFATMTLAICGAFNIVGGLTFAALSVAAPHLLQALYQFLAAAGTQAGMDPSAQLSTAIYGGLMAGWGTLMLLLALGTATLQACALGALVWWLVDSAGSIAVGFPWNALSNTLLLIPFLPVFATLRNRSRQAQ